MRNTAAALFRLEHHRNVQDLHEVHNMLAERVKKWPDRWIAKGLEQGLEQGREQGREQGLEQGRAEAAHATACKLIALAVLSNQQIAEVTGLSLSDINHLRGEGQE